MKLPKSLTTVTTFSKLLALILFALFPFAGFYYGMQYGRVTALNEQANRYQSHFPTPVTPTTILEVFPPTNPAVTANWKSYTSKDKNLLIKYPTNWKIIDENTTDILEGSEGKIEIHYLRSFGGYCPEENLSYIIINSEKFQTCHILESQTESWYQITKRYTKPTTIINTIEPILGVQIDVTSNNNSSENKTTILNILSTINFLNQSVSVSPIQKVCTMEAKQCPDGSYVSRTGPNCEFAACPIK